jgi:hypothetical protein
MIFASGGLIKLEGPGAVTSAVTGAACDCGLPREAMAAIIHCKSRRHGATLRPSPFFRLPLTPPQLALAIVRRRLGGLDEGRNHATGWSGVGWSAAIRTLHWTGLLTFLGSVTKAPASLAETFTATPSVISPGAYIVLRFSFPKKISSGLHAKAIDPIDHANSERAADKVVIARF